MTLLELDNLLLGDNDFKFSSIFDYDIDVDILFESNKGSFADDEGEVVVNFEVLERKEDDLETIVKVIKV